MEMNDLKLKSEVERIFNVKGADSNETHVLAAIITAASKMARCTEIVSENITVEQLLDLYQKNEDKELASLIGMGPQYVNAAIGYHVDFNDYSNSLYAYKSQKEDYDKVYTEVSQRALLNAKDEITK